MASWYTNRCDWYTMNGMEHEKRQEAYTRIRELILSGQLTSAERTSERELAERLEISRTPVREALAVLTANGLIWQQPRVGAFVRDIALDEAIQSVELRAGLESVIVRQIALRPEQISTDDLGGAIAGMNTAAEAHDHHTFMLADTRFHRELARLGRYGNVVTALEGMRDLVHLFRRHAGIQEREVFEVLSEHDEILKALGDPDGHRAAEAMQRHLENTSKRLTRAASAVAHGAVDVAEARIPAGAA